MDYFIRAHESVVQLWTVKNKCGNDERNYQWDNLEELV
jgi:hypothetical protein